MSQMVSRRKCQSIVMNNEAGSTFWCPYQLLKKTAICHYSNETNLGFVNNKQSDGKAILESSCLYNIYICIYIFIFFPEKLYSDLAEVIII